MVSVMPKRVTVSCLHIAASACQAQNENGTTHHDNSPHVCIQASFEIMDYAKILGQKLDNTLACVKP